MDLASPQVSPLSICPIPRILTLEYTFFGQNRVPDLDSKLPQTHRKSGHLRTSGASRRTGLPDIIGRPASHYRTTFMDFRSFRTSRHRTFIHFRTSATCRYHLRLIFVSAITNSSGVRFSRSLARCCARCLMFDF